MPRYRVLKGFHKDKETGNMIKAGKTFFHEHESLDKTSLGKNKLQRVSDEDEDRITKKKKGKKGKKGKKKSKRGSEDEEDESSDGGEELARQTRRDKKAKRIARAEKEAKKSRKNK